MRGQKNADLAEHLSFRQPAQRSVPFGGPDRHLDLSILDQEEPIRWFTFIENTREFRKRLLRQMGGEHLPRGRGQASERGNPAQQPLLGIAEGVRGERKLHEVGKPEGLW